MTDRKTTVLIMAAGTGGHVFPALSIARCLMARSVNVEWLGTPQGMENDILNDTGIKLHWVSVKGLRGSGLRRKLAAPFMLLTALMQSLRIIGHVQPDCVLGMGGFVCGPAGVATKMRGIPLLIHEQNAVAGLTNRLLARISNKVLEAFPNTFSPGGRVVHTGNPLRGEIVALHNSKQVGMNSEEPLKILVLGGSQGAAAINTLVPELIANWESGSVPEFYHQTGSRNLEVTRQQYQESGIELSESCRVEAFIDDMAAAYRWADLVICRSGASTVSELAAAGLPSILVPYPHHKDRQQLLNALWLVNGAAAYVIEQSDLSAALVLGILRELNSERAKLADMSASANALAVCDAGEIIADHCLEVAGA